MYERILLAYDGSLEGRRALREGALLAKRCSAQVYLLAVIDDTGGLRMAEGVQAGAIAQVEEAYAGVLKEGVERLQQAGFNPIAKLVRGEPAKQIGAFARKINADLVVVGHRHQSTFERWWSGPSGANLVDHVPCTLLIARSEISEDAFKATFAATSEVEA